MAQPHRFTPATVATGWLPRGFFSTDGLRDTITSVVPSGWSPHPNLWIVACDYATGRRVPFGREDAPDADLADAVAASCAIPGLFHPVTIGGRRYVDGGIYSASNADILRNEGIDLVICLNPTSTLHPLRAMNPRDVFNIVFQRASGRRLGSEAKRLRAAGSEVILIQPVHEDLKAMGPNLMRAGNRNEVIDVARRTVARQLAEPGIRELLSSLPQGEPERVRRPDAPPSEWPPLIDLQERTA
jgi:NTE family protein